MNRCLPAPLANRANEAVLAYLEPRSAHSDVADALLQAIKALGDVQVFCPDAAQCRYLLASTNNLVFAFAIGMNQVCFRLDSTFRGRAILTGAAALPACGNDWVCFTLFRNDWPAFDLPFWARKAYVFARETSSDLS